MSERDDLLVVSKFKNLILWDLMAGRSAAEVARACEVNLITFYNLLNLKKWPRLRTAGGVRLSESCSDRPPDYCQPAIKIATYFHMLPEDVFPDSLYALRLPKAVERTYSSVELLPLLAAAGEKYALPPPQEDRAFGAELLEQVEGVLLSLPARQQQVIRLRFGLNESQSERSLEEVGEVMHVSVARVRQIQNKALRMLRHPARSRKLRAFVGAEGAETQVSAQ